MEVPGANDFRNNVVCLFLTPEWPTPSGFTVHATTRIHLLYHAYLVFHVAVPF